jgi:preprotein translocase subunit SecE
MARQTRQQRRARREAQATSGARRTPALTPSVPADGRGEAVAAPVAPAVRKTRFGFIGESWAELKKVEWPGQQQVIAGTTVVLVACIIVGLFLYLNDVVWHRVVRDLLLK